MKSQDRFEPFGGGEISLPDKRERQNHRRELCAGTSTVKIWAEERITTRRRGVCGITILNNEGPP